MLFKALVLNADNRFFHVFRDFCVIHPYAVFSAVKSLIFHRIIRIVPFPVDVNKGSIVELELLQIIINRFVLHAVDKGQYGYRYNNTGNHTHGKNSKEYLSNNPSEKAQCSKSCMSRCILLFSGQTVDICFSHLRRLSPFSRHPRAVWYCKFANRAPHKFPLFSKTNPRGDWFEKNDSCTQLRGYPFSDSPAPRRPAKTRIRRSRASPFKYTVLFYCKQKLKSRKQ